MNMLSERKSAMIKVEKDVYKQFEIDAIEAASNESDVDKHEFKSAYKNHLQDLYLDDIINFDEHYPQYFRRFFLTQLFSFIESEMKFICEVINVNKKHLPNMKNLPDRYKEAKNDKLSSFDAYFNYLCEFENVRRIDFSEELEFLYKLRIIRNYITHNMSIVRNTDGTFNLIKELSDKNTGISLIKLENSDDEFEIRLTEDTIIELIIKTATSFFEKLLEVKGKEIFISIVD